MNNFTTLSKSNTKLRNKYNMETLFDVDEFWIDCFKPLNNNDDVCNNNSIDNHHIYKHKRKLSQKDVKNKLLNKVYDKHPEIYQNQIMNKQKNQQRKDAEQRCIQMFINAKEKQIKHNYNIIKNEHKKINDEIKKCTWKPNLNKRYNNLKNSCSDNLLQINKMKKYNKFQMHKIRDEKGIQNDNEETTNLFQPKIYSNINLDKVFNSKNILENKSNYDFLTRYRKARRERLHKRNKIILTKEFSDQCILNGNISDEIKNHYINNNRIDFDEFKIQLRKELNEMTLNNELIFN